MQPADGRPGEQRQDPMPEAGPCCNSARCAGRACLAKHACKGARRTMHLLTHRCKATRGGFRRMAQLRCWRWPRPPAGPGSLPGPRARTACRSASPARRCVAEAAPVFYRPDLQVHGLHALAATPAQKRLLGLGRQWCGLRHQNAHQSDTAVAGRAQEPQQVLARACDAAASGDGCAQPGQLPGASLQDGPGEPADDVVHLLCSAVAEASRAPDLAAAEQAAEQGQPPAPDVLQRARLVANMASLGWPVAREEALRAKGLLDAVARLGTPEPLGEDASDSARLQRGQRQRGRRRGCIAWGKPCTSGRRLMLSHAQPATRALECLQQPRQRPSRLRNGRQRRRRRWRLRSASSRGRAGRGAAAGRTAAGGAQRRARGQVQAQGRWHQAQVQQALQGLAALQRQSVRRVPEPQMEKSVHEQGHHHP